MIYYIYKIACLDNKITDFYIGSTTNIRVRKNQHKTRCNNVNDNRDYNFKIYQTIRNNGGWDNWYMTEIDKLDCDKTESRMKEEEWRVKLNATLNMVRAYKSDEIIAQKKKEYRENNKEIIAQKKKEYRENNKEIIAQKKKEYRENNKEIIAQKKKEYRENNKEMITQRKKEYYEANKDKINAKRRLQRIVNTEILE